MLDESEQLRMALAARIREVIADMPQTKAEISEALGVTPQAITGWETTGRIGKKSLAGLAALSGKAITYFLSGQKSMPEDWSEIQGYAHAVALGDGSSPDDYAEAHKLKFKTSSLRKKGLLGKRIEVYYGRGDSMEPRIKDGDALLVDLNDTTPRDDAIFVLESDEGAVAKRLIEMGGNWFVSSDNGHDPKWKKPVPMNGKRPFRIVGRVRWIGSWED